MTRALPLALGLACGILAHPALAFDRAVAIASFSYQPKRVVAVVGDTVTWTNKDFQPHTATATNASFDSGTLNRGGAFSRSFPSQGGFTYFCRLHPSMRGEIDVFEIWLTGPKRPVVAGSKAVLRGLAPGAAGTVAIERRRRDGTYEAVATAVPRGGGRFLARISQSQPTARYRAVAGELSSPLVTVSSRARVRITITKSGRRAFVVRVSATPAQHGAPVVLQRRQRSRWVRVAKSRLNEASRARFAIATNRPVRIRVALRRGVGGYKAGVSRVVVLRPA